MFDRHKTSRDSLDWLNVHVKYFLSHIFGKQSLSLNNVERVNSAMTCSLEALHLISNKIC